MSGDPPSPYGHLFDAFNAQRRDEPPPARKGGLLGFLRRKDAPPAPAPHAGTVVAATNAPAHWPAVRIPASPPEDPGLARLAVEGAVVSALAGWTGSARLRRLAATRLHPEGILWTPAVVEEGGARRHVFVYPRADAEAAGRFEGTRRALRDLGEAEPVYYAPSPLPAAEPADPFRHFGAMAFQRNPSPATEPSAAWWAAGDDPDFAASATCRAMERANVALDGIHSYVFSAWLFEHDPQPGQTRRVALPSNLYSFALLGPEDVPVWVSADAEKGFRLHFLEGTPRAYRETLWAHLAEYAEGWRGQVEANGWQKDPPADPDPLGHWRFFLKALRTQQAQGMTITAVGVLHTVPAR